MLFESFTARTSVMIGGILIVGHQLSMKDWHQVDKALAYPYKAATLAKGDRVEFARIEVDVSVVWVRAICARHLVDQSLRNAGITESG